ncbi:exo-alpha-sialidase [Bremerella sp. T1]|uniref:exo-alpha-sialidase n=1 Tax=Bremerella sp. TYQ1 TaxID=3119568 RepID=UPI001CC94654|nr:exo-alpha-sialidase [Bremerella volcania]UBM37351.1 exo-alpha-sialidase [Bremerella volcania]
MFRIAVLASLLVSGLTVQATLAAEPTTKEYSPVMLAGDWVPESPHQIDFDRLPKIPSQHVIVSDVRKSKGVNQHNYLTFYDGKYWAMWSDGPAVEDRVGQRISYATSPDGLDWTEPKYLTPEPPGSGKGSQYYNTRSSKGFRWISRGFWQRDGQLLALCSLDEGAGFFGKSLELRAFRWGKKSNTWIDHALVHKNAINNFPPKKIPSGEWMMSRRTHDYSKHGVEFLTGGIEAIDDWDSFPVLGSSQELAAEEPYWWVLPDGRLTALFRDNRQSGYLYRSFSEDNGRTWSLPHRTDFPDARSKFSGVQLADGRYVLVNNPHPKQRDPLALSISDDGVVFTKMGYLAGGRHVDYPHVIEHDGHVLVAFATQKQTVEVLKIKLEDLDALTMPEMPLVKPPPYQPKESDTIIDAGQSNQVTITGPWKSSDKDSQRHGDDYLFLNPTESGTIRFDVDVPAAGDYEIFTLWNARGHRAHEVPFRVTHAEGTKTVNVNQNRDSGSWNSLGTYRLTPGTAAVEVAIDQAKAFVIVDAILVAPRP